MFLDMDVESVVIRSRDDIFEEARYVGVWREGCGCRDTSNPKTRNSGHQCHVKPRIRA